MNHKAIVVAQLKEEASQLRESLARVENAIQALGGNVESGVSNGQKRQKRSGRPKGSKNVERAARTPAKATDAISGDSPALAQELEAIKARTDLTGLQKAQECRRARFRHRQVAAASQNEGQRADLAEAATT